MTIESTDKKQGLPVHEEELIQYGAVIEWYRPDLFWPVFRTWAWAALMVASGALCGGLSLAMQIAIESWTRILMRMFGLLLTLCGALYAALSLPRVLSDETYLALFQEGVVFREKDQHHFVSWDDLMEARVGSEEEILLLLLRREEELLITYRFVGIKVPELCKRINHYRRQQQMGLPLRIPKSLS